MQNIKEYVIAVTLLVPVMSNAMETQSLFSGSYFGLNLGAARGASKFNTNPGCLAAGLDAVFCNASPDPSSVNGTAVAASGSNTLRPHGLAGGVEVGHNWQKDRIVFGGEADFGVLNLHQSYTTNGLFPFTFLGNAYTLTESISTDWLATVRGRLGTTMLPSILVYATGGAAFTRYKTYSSYHDNAIGATFPGGSGYGTSANTRTGWTLGAGGEWQFTDSLSLKAEYIYADFGSTAIAVPLSNSAQFSQTMYVNFDLDASLVRLGLNYRV